MLRDAMCRLPYFETWDCDEINPIWRHGNIAYPNDEFSPEMATRPVNHFIRNRFLKEWKRSGQPQFLLEKTCANSLRVGFVDKVLPEAKYIFLVRNGLDVVASAQKRWRGDMEVESLPYYWSKVRNTPIFDLPIYGLRFLQARISMVLGTKDHMSFWGPKFSELTKLPPSMPLEELCALQWQACIENSLRDFALMDGQKHLTLRYEDFVSSPEQQLGKILDFLEVNGSSED
ncbi:MAG: sulfotransferase, partial [Lentilitoribacter sp.]